MSIIEPRAVVLALVTRETPTGREVLLGKKLTGFGAGNIVAPGGKVDPGEGDVEAAVRELEEETSLRTEVEQLKHCATVLFRFPARPASDMDCQVFSTTSFTGTAASSTELEVQWFDTECLPAEQMWQDADQWLPRILAGEELTATVVMSNDNVGVDRVEFSTWS